MIIPMENQEYLVSEMSSRLHDDQSIEIQLEGLPSRGKDKKCIQKLENLILQLFENEVINDMQQEAGLILKSEIFDEAWLFGYVLSSRDMGHARNFRGRIQGAHSYSNPWKLKNCHMLVQPGISFSQLVNGFA